MRLLDTDSKKGLLPQPPEFFKNCLYIQMKRFTPKPSPPLLPLPSLPQKRVNIVPNNQEFPMHDASTTLSGVVSAAVPHVPDVRTITRFKKRSMNKGKQQGRRTEVLRQATNSGGSQLCVKPLQMTMTRAWTLEMTEDWTHTRITEHDKAYALQRTSEHFDSSLAHTTARPSQAKVCARNKIVHASLEDDVARKKTPWSVPSTDVIAVTRKQRRKVPKKQKLRGSSPQTLQLRSSLARPRMALLPGRRRSPSASLSPSRRILPFRKCTSQQPLQLAVRLRRDLIMACGDQCESRVIFTGKGERV